MIAGDLITKAKWLYGGCSYAQIVRAILSDATMSMLLYRGMSTMNRNSITKPLAFLLAKLNAVFCGAVIGLNARFERNFVILHSVGIVINSKVRGGENIILESGVVIGEEKKGCPILGSNIFVGSGAKLFGAITIGNNVIIGANAVVNKSVPDNVVVAGIPARIVRHTDLDE
jgi:serine O-acetyltransferase